MLRRRASGACKQRAMTAGTSWAFALFYANTNVEHRRPDLGKAAVKQAVLSFQIGNSGKAAPER